MGESATVAAALDAALSKTLSAVPDPLPPADAHEATLAHRRACERVRDAIAAYAPPRLPAPVWARRVVDAGARLHARGQNGLAAEACFLPVLAIALAGGGGNSSSAEADASDRGAQSLADLELHARASLGLAACQGAAALARDPRASHPDTLAAALRALHGVRAAAMQALPHEPLYLSLIHISQGIVR